MPSFALTKTFTPYNVMSDRDFERGVMLCDETDPFEIAAACLEALHCGDLVSELSGDFIEARNGGIEFTIAADCGEYAFTLTPVDEHDAVDLDAVEPDAITGI